MSEYRKALKREADRERSWRKSRQGMFESSMPSLDEHVAKFDDPSKIAVFSDGGKGEEAVMASVAKSFYTLCIADARERLNACDRKLVPVFDLVVKNGTNREESICELAARDKHGKKEAKDRYSRNLEEILKFFRAQ